MVSSADATLESLIDEVNTNNDEVSSYKCSTLLLDDVPF